MKNKHSCHVIPESESRRYHLIVSKETHKAVIQFAKTRNWTVHETTRYLIKLAFAALYGNE